MATSLKSTGVNGYVYPTKLMNSTGNNGAYRRGFVIMSDGSVRAWGYNGTYGLGDGDNGDSPFAHSVAFPVTFTGALEVAAPGQNSINACIENNGHLWTWGILNTYGSAGNGSQAAPTFPYDASANPLNSIYNKTVVQVAMPDGAEGTDFIVVRCSDGTVHTAGYNAYGQWGNATTNTYNFIFNQVTGITNASYVFCGRENYTTVGCVTSTGALYMWGYNAANNIGNGTTTNQASPVLVNNGSLSGKTIVKAACWWSGTFALCSDGTLHAWGYSSNGIFGTNLTGTRTTPLQVNTNVATITCNGFGANEGAVITKTDNTLWFSGYAVNINGSAAYTATILHDMDGEGTTDGVTYDATPVVSPLSNNTTWRQITGWTGTIQKVVHYYYGIHVRIYLLTTDGTIFAWGLNNFGQLGLGTGETWVGIGYQGGVFGTISALPALVAAAATPHKTLCEPAADITCTGYSNEGLLIILTKNNIIKVSGYGGSYASGHFQARTNVAPKQIHFH